MARTFFNFVWVTKKNILLFWRSWFQAIFVIVVPLLLVSVLVFLRGRATREVVKQPLNWSSFRVDSGFYFSHKYVAYAPNDTLNLQLMNAVHMYTNLQPFGFKTEGDAIAFFQSNDVRSKETLGAVIFDPFSNLSVASYTIRLRSKNDWSTRVLFPMFFKGGPRSKDIAASPPNYKEEFLVLQYAIDRSLININCKANDSSQKLKVVLQRMPFPPYIKDEFIIIIQKQLALMLILGFIFPTLYCTRLILIEKQRGMKLLGLGESTYWFSWLITNLFVFTLISLFLSILLCFQLSGNGPILGLSNPFLIFLSLLLYGVSIFTFGFALSTLFNSAHTGVAIVCTVLIVISLPYPLLERHYNELNIFIKMFACLLPSLGMGFLCILIGQFEGAGLGVQFSSYFKPASPDDSLSIHLLCSMFIFDSIVFLILTHYISAVWPGKYGIPKPWYFPFLCLCRRKLTFEVLLDNLKPNELTRNVKETTRLLSLPNTDGRNEELQTNQQININNTEFIPSDPFPEKNEPLLEHNGDGVDTLERLSTPSSDMHEYFETEPIGLQVGIAIDHLCKVYSNKQSTVVAVSGLTMNIYEGQITVLLGHNGAGKTTTLSILTGLYPPTSGTAYIYGHDIRNDIEGIHGNLGFCSQHDVLYDTLTVEEHLYLSAHLRGCDNSTIEQQVERTLRKIYLRDKKSEYTKTLSGGMKRRLSIGMALIGDSKILILDEPTSGLDPEARRQVWDILQAERQQKTILVTTHYMDEADHLGDRIAIMAGGELKCYGSPLFLKAKYGAGYLLSIVKQSSCSSDYVLKQVKHHIPNAFTRSDYGEEIRILLPLESIDKFGNLFENLESNKISLGISSFGVSVTTMEEVFFQVSKQTNIVSCCSRETRERRCKTTEQSRCTPETKVDRKQLRNQGFLFYRQQFCALMIKRYIFTKRNLIFVLSQIIVPIAFTLIALFIFHHLLNKNNSLDPRLDLSLKPYGKDLLLTFSNEAEGWEKRQNTDQFIQSYMRQFDSKQVTPIEFNTSTGSYEDHLLKQIAIPHLFYFRLKSIIGLVVDTKSTLKDQMISLRAYFQGESFHAAPISLNAVVNGFLQYLTSVNQTICPGLTTNNSPPQIYVSNQPLPETKEERAKQIDEIEGLMRVVVAGFPLASNILFAASYLASCFSFFPVYETVTKAKHLQFVSGVKLALYWISIYVWDLCIFFLSVGSILLCFMAFNLEQFALGERFHNLVILFGLFMWAVLPQTYLLSRLFRSPTSGLVWITAINVFTASIGLIMVGLLSHPMIHQQAVGVCLMYFWIAISPSFCLSHGIFQLFINYQFRQVCDSPLVQFLCLVDQVNACCLKTCDPFCAYWTNNELSYELGGVGAHLTALSIHGFLYFSLVLISDSSIGRNLKICLIILYKRFRYRHHNPELLLLNQYHDDLSFDDGNLPAEDVDVRQHRHLVESLPYARLKEQTSLALCRVSKTYGSINPRCKQNKKPAVDRLSLAIAPSECFGLLGVNGAGKTTTFRMITGDLEPSSGHIIVVGHDLNRNLRKAQQSLGYCPQFDALLPYLTGYETLQLFARLRGIQEGFLNTEIDQLLSDLKLTDLAHVLVSRYSGGNRRKLSVAIALVGETPLICLDEPTTGVDPISRRHIWNLLLKYRRQGRTLVLSSHSMEECEALCSRVSIVVNGRMKCLGTCQHLKARFGHGYSLNIQVMIPMVNHHLSSLNAEPTVSSTSSSRVPHQLSLINAVNNVDSFIKREFPDARLVDRHQGVLQYHLPTDGRNQIRLSHIFHLMESNKTRLGLLNYSINQTTLEQIFIDLIKLQEGPANH
ncbi:unnamed protein product [Schistosoma margrebowiei]|uniref:ABC transporter domain-containing protein n=1 Tax=Schistosoma margrebowiei TaxID=48269 RepID=A0AA85AR40_9TREM|nr:unnamed protein product [Schistosoma margrebowiei]